MELILMVIIMSSLDMQHMARERVRFHADGTDSQREASPNHFRSWDMLMRLILHAPSEPAQG